MGSLGVGLGIQIYLQSFFIFYILVIFRSILEQDRQVDLFHETGIKVRSVVVCIGIKSKMLAVFIIFT